MVDDTFHAVVVVIEIHLFWWYREIIGKV